MMNAGRMFRRYIGVDYSGERRPTHSIGGLAICAMDAGGRHEFPDSLSPRSDNWKRGDVATWLAERLQERDTPTLVGIDHGFSFPVEYFNRYGDPWERWDDFLADFRDHWPTHEQRVVDLIRGHRKRFEEDELRDEAERRNDHRWGNPTWFRLTEKHSRCDPASVFDFDVIPVQKQVATSTHAGLPWLLDVRERLQGTQARVHFWPFDCWKVPEDYSVVVEVYPALWNGKFPNETAGLQDSHRRDAYSVARWMWEKDRNGLLRPYFDPGVAKAHEQRARKEGWIFGIEWSN